MIYLKTYFYTHLEIPYIIANLKECYNHIDKMIACEYNVHHTGMSRDFMFQDIKDHIPEQLRDKFDYHACDIKSHTVEAYDNENAIHAVNEPAMRGWFVKLYDLKPDDIVLSIDADEIFYRQKLDYLIDKVEKYGKIAAKMRQFFFKKTYLWKGKDWISPLAVKVKHMDITGLGNWRDEGIPTEEYVGAHFSWCMSPKEMVHKLNTYSHPRYRHLANEEVLAKGIEDKKYIFDSSVHFDIEEIESNSELIPLSMRE